MHSLPHEGGRPPLSTRWPQGRRMASTWGMRARQAEPSLVRPGEPDEYGTWTAERLEGWLRASTGREPVIVVSHRAPRRSSQAIDSRTRGPVELESSGIVSAVEPLIRACSGVWVAHGEEEDTHHRRSATVPRSPRFSRRRSTARLLLRLRERGAVADVSPRARQADVPA